MVKCPRKYSDKLKAQMAALDRRVISKGKQEPTVYECSVCKGFHLKEGK
jgi:hypothetical protein